MADAAVLSALLRNRSSLDPSQQAQLDIVLRRSLSQLRRRYSPEEIWRDLLPPPPGNARAGARAAAAPRRASLAASPLVSPAAQARPAAAAAARPAQQERSRAMEELTTRVAGRRLSARCLPRQLSPGPQHSRIRSGYAACLL